MRANGRYIVVSEHKPIPVVHYHPEFHEQVITDDERDELLILSYQTKSRGLKQVFLIDGRRSIKTTSIVGAIKLSTGTVIEILPKFSADTLDSPNALARHRSTLLQMILLSRDDNPIFLESISIKDDAQEIPLLENFVLIFARSLIKELLKGLESSYHSVEKKSTYLKGRILLQKQFRDGIKGGVGAHIICDEFSENNPLMQFFKASLRHLLNQSDFSFVTKSALTEAFYLLNDVDDVRLSSVATKIYSFNRHNERFANLYSQCIYIISKYYPYTSCESGNDFFSILYNMDELYERFLSFLFERDRIPFKEQSRLSGYTRGIRKNIYGKPDFVFLSKNNSRQIIGVGDAKWKLLTKESSLLGLDMANFWQLTSYMHLASPESVPGYFFVPTSDEQSHTFIFDPDGHSSHPIVVFAISFTQTIERLLGTTKFVYQDDGQNLQMLVYRTEAEWLHAAIQELEDKKSIFGETNFVHKIQHQYKYLNEVFSPLLDGTTIKEKRLEGIFSKFEEYVNPDSEEKYFWENFKKQFQHIANLNSVVEKNFIENFARSLMDSVGSFNKALSLKKAASLISKQVENNLNFIDIDTVVNNNVFLLDKFFELFSDFNTPSFSRGVIIFIEWLFETIQYAAKRNFLSINARLTNKNTNFAGDIGLIHVKEYFLNEISLLRVKTMGDLIEIEKSNGDKYEPLCVFTKVVHFSEKRIETAGGVLVEFMLESMNKLARKVDPKEPNQNQLKRIKDALSLDSTNEEIETIIRASNSLTEYKKKIVSIENVDIKKNLSQALLNQFCNFYFTEQKKKLFPLVCEILTTQQNLDDETMKRVGKYLSSDEMIELIQNATDDSYASILFVHKAHMSNSSSINLTSEQIKEFLSKIDNNASEKKKNFILDIMIEIYNEVVLPEEFIIPFFLRMGGLNTFLNKQLNPKKELYKRTNEFWAEFIALAINLRTNLETYPMYSSTKNILGQHTSFIEWFSTFIKQYTLGDEISSEDVEKILRYSNVFVYHGEITSKAWPIIARFSPVIFYIEKIVASIEKASEEVFVETVFGLLRNQYFISSKNNDIDLYTKYGKTIENLAHKAVNLDEQPQMRVFGQIASNWCKNEDTIHFILETFSNNIYIIEKLSYDKRVFYPPFKISMNQILKELNIGRYISLHEAEYTQKNNSNFGNTLAEQLSKLKTSNTN